MKFAYESTKLDHTQSSRSDRSRWAAPFAIYIQAATVRKGDQLVRYLYSRNVFTTLNAAKSSFQEFLTTSRDSRSRKLVSVQLSSSDLDFLCSFYINLPVKYRLILTGSCYIPAMTYLNSTHASLCSWPFFFYLGHVCCLPRKQFRYGKVIKLFLNRTFL